MDADFARFNVEYFLAVRDFANQNPTLAPALFGMSPELLKAIAGLTPHQLSNLALVTVPLVIPRQNGTWWPRFVQALADGDRAELMTLAAEASYYLIGPRPNAP
jgi:hypothetical protein